MYNGRENRYKRRYFSDSLIKQKACMKQLVVVIMVMLFADANAQSYQLQIEGSSITVLQNDAKTTVSNNTDAASVMDYQQKIYFISKDGDGAIKAYDVNTKKTTDVVSVGMKSETGYVVKSVINMIPDTKGGKIYFTTKDIYRGSVQYMTWRYDISTKAYDVYCDGKALSLSADNVLEVMFTGKDMNGEYEQKAYFNASYRQLIKQDDKVYSAIK